MFVSSGHKFTTIKSDESCLVTMTMPPVLRKIFKRIYRDQAAHKNKKKIREPLTVRPSWFDLFAFHVPISFIHSHFHHHLMSHFSHTTNLIFLLFLYYFYFSSVQSFFSNRIRFTIGRRNSRHLLFRSVRQIQCARHGVTRSIAWRFVWFVWSAFCVENCYHDSNTISK